MLPKLPITRPLKLHDLVKLLLIIILLTIAIRLLWERAMLLYESAQIRQMLATFHQAVKNQDIDLAYAQCLPLEQGGKLSPREVQAILDYNFMAPLYLETEIDLLKSKIRPIWIQGRITLEANINGTVIYDSPSTTPFRVLLRKWNGRWYIIEFRL